MEKIQIEDQLWCLSEYAEHRQIIAHIPVLVIVGPSGSGKTSMLQSRELAGLPVKELQMLTSRPKRDSDSDALYLHVPPASLSFEQLSTQESIVLMARLQPFPQYAWNFRDLLECASSGTIPIFTFRHGGANLLLDVFKLGTIVSIEPNPPLAVTASLDQVDHHDSETVMEMIKKNQILGARAVERGWKFLRVKNPFDGVGRLDEIAKKVACECLLLHSRRWGVK